MMATKKKVQHESECAYEDNELRFMCGELTGFAGEDYVFYCSDCKNKIIGYQVGIKERGDSILKMCKECQSGVIEGKAETKKQVLEMMNKLEGSQAETSWLELREQVEKI